MLHFLNVTEIVLFVGHPKFDRFIKTDDTDSKSIPAANLPNVISWLILGGWEGNANFKIDFPKGGAIEFAEEFQKAVKKCKFLYDYQVT